mmetsp:Transcript_32615/g.50754  ORF Transcript_32615/g.50754 Transcript_32615/m.50754 type:complete len:327 (+) Transcript_32615:114-1094(+)
MAICNPSSMLAELKCLAPDANPGQAGAANQRLSMQELSEYFHLPEKQVAEQLGMCLTSLKKVCRAHGITRWPFRKLKSLERTMKKITKESSVLSAMAPGTAPPMAVPSAASFPIGPGLVHTLQPTGAKAEEADAGAKGLASQGSNGHGAQVAGCQSAEVKKEFDHEGVEGPEAEAGADMAWSEDWPVARVGGEGLKEVTIINWSELWTVQSLRKHLLRPLGGADIVFSSDGGEAVLKFTTSVVAQQALKVCRKACTLLRQRRTEQQRALISVLDLSGLDHEGSGGLSAISSSESSSHSVTQPPSHSPNPKQRGPLITDNMPRKLRP